MSRIKLKIKGNHRHWEGIQSTGPGLVFVPISDQSAAKRFGAVALAGVALLITLVYLNQQGTIDRGFFLLLMVPSVVAIFFGSLLAYGSLFGKEQT